MIRYIDADHLKKSVEGLTDCYNGFSDTYDKACIIGLIDEEPTVDAVPVVRCRDCKYSEPWEYKYEVTLKCLYGRRVMGNWFCEHGEKVTE